MSVVDELKQKRAELEPTLSEIAKEQIEFQKLVTALDLVIGIFDPDSGCPHRRTYAHRGFPSLLTRGRRSTPQIERDEQKAAARTVRVMTTLHWTAYRGSAARRPRVGSKLYSYHPELDQR